MMSGKRCGRWPAQIRSPLADNPRLAPSLTGDAPLYAVDQGAVWPLRPRFAVSKSPRRRARYGSHRRSFALRLRAARVGTVSRRAFYGAESGDPVFGFRLPPAMGQKRWPKSKSASRLSSNGPGVRHRLAAADRSRWRELDGMLIGQATVIPDDGHGGMVFVSDFGPADFGGKLSTGEHIAAAACPAGTAGPRTVSVRRCARPKACETDYGPLQILLHSAHPATGNSQRRR